MIARSSNLAQKPGGPTIGDLPFDAVIEAFPTHAGMELFGWASGRRGFSFRQFIGLPEVIEFDVQIPQPTAVLPHFRLGEGGSGPAPPTGQDDSPTPPDDES